MCTSRLSVFVYSLRGRKGQTLHPLKSEAEGGVFLEIKIRLAACCRFILVGIKKERRPSEGSEFFMLWALKQPEGSSRSHAGFVMPGLTLSCPLLSFSKKDFLKRCYWCFPEWWAPSGFARSQRENLQEQGGFTQPVRLCVSPSSPSTAVYKSKENIAIRKK